MPKSKHKKLQEIESMRLDEDGHVVIVTPPETKPVTAEEVFTQALRRKPNVVIRSSHH
jgi:hypothetical protein